MKLSLKKLKLTLKDLYFHLNTITNNSIIVKSLFKLFLKIMSSSSKVYAGSKTLTVRDPSVLLKLINSGLYIPKVTTHKVTKENDVLYTLSIVNTINDTELDVSFEIPETLTSTVKMGISPITRQESSRPVRAPIWESETSEAEIYKIQIGEILRHWLINIQTASKACNLDEEEPRIYLPQNVTELKWPWKTQSEEDYFEKFNPETQTHILKLGVGYYKREGNYIGVSLQLGGYPGKTKSAIAADALQSRKRKRKQPENEEETTVVASE